MTLQGFLSDAARRLQSLQSTPRRTIVSHFCLFILSFTLGLILTAPWGRLWLSAIETFLPAPLEWSEMREAGPMSFHIISPRIAAGRTTIAADDLRMRSVFSFQASAVSATTPRGAFAVDNAFLRLGLFTPATLSIDTGPRLDIGVGYGKDLSIRGAVDVARLLQATGASGEFSLDGDFSFAEWGAPPENGDFQLTSAEIRLPNGIIVRGLTFNVEISGDNAQILTVESTEPVPFRASGSAALNWKNLPDTRFSVSGNVTLGGQEKSFTRSGRLADFF